MSNFHIKFRCSNGQNYYYTEFALSSAKFRTFVTIFVTLTTLLFSSMATKTESRKPNRAFSPAKFNNVSFPSPILNILDQYVEMDNGILKVTLSKPGGSVVGISYNGVDNLLEGLNGEANRGYWDIVWIGNGSTGKKGSLDRLEGTDFNVILENEEQIEISFTRSWNFSLDGKQVPLNIDKRFIMLRGSSGFYSYGIYEHLDGWPAFNLTNTRIAFKLRKDKFHYMAISDDRQRYMPLPDDREAERGQVLDYPEAVKLVNPIEPQFKGEVDDKYEYSMENKDNRVHGWISTDPAVGFWQITPSDEFRSGGPLKQGLTSHVGPTTLAIFHSTHYAGEDLIMKFGQNEAWKKVYGPVFIYLNFALEEEGDPIQLLWQDAKEQAEIEMQSWPYEFPKSEDFQCSYQRGNIYGRLLVSDSYISKFPMSAAGAFVGLAPPGEAAGSWQRESKGYQFWRRVDENGYFCINNIRAGDYNLYAFVPGFIGDYKYNDIITITPGCDIDMGDLIYEPPRVGPTLWEIGVPDRSAAEFYVPDPNPKYVNTLYIDHPEKFRQYGLWERYTELYPDEDLIYTVGVSDYSQDWFFAQVTRKTDNKTYKGSTWQIRFNLDTVEMAHTYVLRIALATAHISELQVRINDDGDQAKSPIFSTGVIGKDNTVARHGIHGLYWLYSIDIPGSSLVQGNNTIYLTRKNSISPFQGIMYDYIRLEAPPDNLLGRTNLGLRF